MRCSGFILGAFVFTQIAFVDAAYGGDAPQADTRPHGPFTYIRVPMTGTIGKDFTAEHMAAYLQQAVAAKPTVVLLDIDTSQGELADVEKIVDLMNASGGIRFVAIVRKALSAGVPIALACSEVYLSEVGTIGCATGPAPKADAEPKDRGATRQTAWRDLCRKAAQHGGHPAVLADAMTDPGFELTARKEGDRLVLAGAGRGEVVKPIGTILTMTAQEAVRYGLAKDLVRDAEDLGKKLRMSGWQQVPGAPLPATVAKEGTIGETYDALVEQIKPFSLTDPTLSPDQKDDRIKQYRRWAQEQGIIGRKVYWVLTIKEAGVSPGMPKDPEASVASASKSLAEQYRRAAKASSPEQRQKYAQNIERSRQYLANAEKMLKYPFRVVAYGHGDRVRVYGQLSREAEEFLTKEGKGSEIRLAGRIIDVDLYPGLPGKEPVIIIRMEDCSLFDERPKPTPPRSAQQIAEGNLKLAQQYISAGLNDKAGKVLEEIIRTYPDTETAEAAKEALTKCRAQAPSTYLRVPIMGIIGKDFTAEHISAHLQRAAALKATAVLLDINTFQGELSETEKIIDLLIASEQVRVVGLVRKAVSAGVPIALACQDVYVTAQATIGPAMDYPHSAKELDAMPKEVREKLQAAWGDLCRKAAQHGGHPAVLADAMVDPSFELTVSTVGDRQVLKKNAEEHGRVIKYRGRVLALDANTAVSCGFAKAVVRDVPELAQSLRTEGWREASGVVGTTGPALPEKGSMAEICAPLMKEFESLSLGDPKMTEIQRTQRIKQWQQWVRTQGIIGQQVYWVLTLEKSSLAYDPEEMERMVQRYKESLDEHAKQATDRSAPYERREVHRKAAQELREQLARAIKAQQSPYKVVAYGYEARVRVEAQVSREAKDFLGTAYAGSPIQLKGQIADITLRAAHANEGATVTIALDDCTLFEKAPPAKPSEPPRTPQKIAETNLKLARQYLNAGMKSKATAILKEIVKTYADTKAAEQAQSLLETIGGP